MTGVLTAASATGQLIFLPIVALMATAHGWRTAVLVVTAVAVAVIPVAGLLLRSWPADKGIAPFGATEVVAPAAPAGGAVKAAFSGLVLGARRPAFWLLAGSFAICGATTNGLLQTHFIPAAGDHGMPATAAASLLAFIGVFDVIGTIASGWLTDRVDSRILLVIYYLGRGLALALLPSLLTPDVAPGLMVFVLFYGLDWVATVPPTMALAREHFGESTPVVFGWIFASHQLGAAVAAFGAGYIRDASGVTTPRSTPRARCAWRPRSCAGRSPGSRPGRNPGAGGRLSPRITDVGTPGSKNQQNPHSPLAASWVKQFGHSFGLGSGLAGAAAFVGRADGAFVLGSAAGRALTTRPFATALVGLIRDAFAAAARRASSSLGVSCGPAPAGTVAPKCR
ncbi:hypothetical protein MTP03_45840 [Tsukamurella sp. PLM1]|nr:hypothetical protein MTP03_45840 [Tsukamurella sp. PLM1]